MSQLVDSLGKMIEVEVRKIAVRDWIIYDERFELTFKCRNVVAKDIPAEVLTPTKLGL